MYLICEICGNEASCKHHLIFGFSGGRKKADEDGLIMNVCSKCHTNSVSPSHRIHDNVVAERMSKIIGQERWEKAAISKGATPEQARKDFMKRYGKSYIWN